MVFAANHWPCQMAHRQWARVRISTCVWSGRNAKAVTSCQRPASMQAAHDPDKIWLRRSGQPHTCMAGTWLSAHCKATECLKRIN